MSVQTFHPKKRKGNIMCMFDRNELQLDGFFRAVLVQIQMPA